MRISTKFKTLFATAALSLMAATGAAQAQAVTDFSGLKGKSEVYLKGGLLGVGAGYAYGLNEKFTLRADITTAGRISRDQTVDDFDFNGRFRNDVATIYGDWFPFEDSGFRVTAGLGLRDTKLSGDANSNSFGQVTIGGQSINYGGPGDSANASIKLPAVTPYLGVGYGFNIGQRAKEGFTFIADAGVYYGKPKVSFDVSQSVYDKLNVASGGRAQELIDQQRDDLYNDVKKYRFMPSVYIGVGYRF